MMLDDDLDRLLEDAAAQARDLTLESLPDDSQLDHQFSELFEKKIELLGKTRSKTRLNWSRLGRRAAAFAAVSLMGLSALVLSVDAWRETLFEMVERKHAQFSEISFESKDGSGVLESDFVLCEHRPAYLPEGYVLTEQRLNESFNSMVFTTADDSMIGFEQAVNAKEGFARSVGINTEGSELTPCEVNGYLGHQMSNQGTQFVLWNDNYYNYMIITQLPMDEAMKIAQSVTIAPEHAYHPPQLAVPNHELGEDYTVEQAMRNGDVVITEGGIQNADQIAGLLAAIDQGEAHIIRIADFTVTEEEAASFGIEGFHLGDPVTKELYFDTQRIHYDVNFLRAGHSVGQGGSALTVQQDTDGVQKLVLTGRNGKRIPVCSYNQIP